MRAIDSLYSQVCVLCILCAYSWQQAYQVVKSSDSWRIHNTRQEEEREAAV